MGSCPRYALLILHGKATKPREDEFRGRVGKIIERTLAGEARMKTSKDRIVERKRVRLWLQLWRINNSWFFWVDPRRHPFFWKGKLHLHVSQFSWNKCSWTLIHFLAPCFCEMRKEGKMDFAVCCCNLVSSVLFGLLLSELFLSGVPTSMALRRL